MRGSGKIICWKEGKRREKCEGIKAFSQHILTKHSVGMEWVGRKRGKIKATRIYFGVHGRKGSRKKERKNIEQEGKKPERKEKRERE